jgi:hypothetical protein
VVGNGFVGVSLTQLLKAQFIKTHGVCLLLSLIGLFGPTFICVRVGEPDVCKERINVYYNTLFYLDSRRRLEIHLHNR